VRTAIMTKRGADALSWLTAFTTRQTPSAAVLVARSKLLASIDARGDALQSARDAAQLSPPQAIAFEQLASLHADAGDIAQLDAAVTQLQRLAREHAATHYYAAVALFLRGNAAGAVERAQAAVRIDPAYAAVYDLIGAAFTKLDDVPRARDAFLTSLRYDAHDSAAYANLGVLELAAGHRAAAANYFAEALWLDAESPLAREGLARATASY
jgi:Flp pilus assembly protein TadD